MIKTFQYKLYPNQSQIVEFEKWISICCWTYNRALEHRIKAYRRRAMNVTFYDQVYLLTHWRTKIKSLSSVPRWFEMDSLARVDRGMKAFFRRLKSGGIPGFPRFRSNKRYNSLSYSKVGNYISGSHIRIPNLGYIRCRGRTVPRGIQRVLRIIRRSTGWYAQIVLDDRKTPLNVKPINSAIGIDVGLDSFATLSNGSKIDNPRFGMLSIRKLRALHRRVSRRVRGSKRQQRAVKILGQQHELVANQRRCFCHQQSTALVRKYDLIGYENLNINNMVRSRFAKSILDAAWGTFCNQIVVKAANAGQQAIAVDPRSTSQTCPDCGAIVKKKLSERTHSCECGLVCDRDHAAAQVILARALAVSGATRARTDPTSGKKKSSTYQVGRMKRIGLLSNK